ncbi:MAG: MBL fold metallo-hydrolase [Porphyromonas sp.]|nr:MBL fold metallo-hydrolase [Porphyromonas sp.]
MNRLYFIAHSCYLWESPDAYLLFDYYGAGDPWQWLSHLDEKPLYILTTHSHHDHYSPVIFEAVERYGGAVKYICHAELLNTLQDQIGAYELHILETGQSYADGLLQVKAFGSTDLGGSFYCEVGGAKLFHAGDLNNWHWNEEANDYYIRQYEADWHRELERLTAEVQEVDLLMFPTDLRLGKDYLKGLRELLQKMKVNYLAPMHLNGRLDPTQLEAFAGERQFRLLLPDASHPYDIVL